MVVTKRAPADSNTNYAQGGVAAVLDPGDTADAHIEDTLRVGDGLCHADVVERCVREAPTHIRRFAEEIGVAFDRDATGDFVLGREGGHTARRIVHVKDMTGRAIETALLDRVAERGDRIRMLPDHMAIDLLTTAKYGGPNAVFGAYVYDQRTGVIRTIVARARGAGHGRRGQGVPLYLQPGRGDRRRHRHGLPGGRRRGEHGIFPVPPHLPLPPSRRRRF